MLDRRVILRDVNECLVDVGAEVLEQRLRNGQRETAGPCGIEQKGIRSADKGPLRAVVQVEVGAAIEILRDVGGDRRVVLVELRDVLQGCAREAQHRPIERRHLAVVLAVQAHRRIELGMFDDDVSKPALLRLAPDCDVEIVLQGPDHGVGERLGFAPLGGRGFGDLQPKGRWDGAEDRDQGTAQQRYAPLESSGHNKLLDAVPWLAHTGGVPMVEAWYHKRRMVSTAGED